MTNEEFTQFYSDQKNYIKKVINKVMGGGAKQDIEDVSQEILISVFLKMDSFKGEAALTTWLSSVCRNTTYKWLAKQNAAKRKGIHIPQEEVHLDYLTDKFNPSSPCKQLELEQAVKAGLKRLKKKDAQFFTDCFFGEHSKKEHCEQLGITAPRYEAKKHRVIKKFLGLK